MFVGLTYLAAYTFHSDTGDKYLACRQRLYTTDITSIHVGKGGKKAPRYLRIINTRTHMHFRLAMEPDGTM